MMTTANINFHKNFMTEDFKPLGFISKLMSSGLVAGNAILAEKLASAGTGSVIEFPFVDVSASGEGTAGSDNSTKISGRNLGKGSLKAFATYRNDAIEHASILGTAKKDGIKLSEAVVTSLGVWRTNMLESKLTHLIRGVVGAVKASSLKVVHTNEAEKISLNDIVYAKALTTKEMKYIVMSSLTKADLVTANRELYTVAAQTVDKDFDTFDGMKIIIGDFDRGEAVLFEDGAIISEDVDVEGGTLVYDEDKSANGGSGSEMSILRTCNVQSVNGVSFTGTPASVFNITNAEFADPANYTLEFDETTTPLVVIKAKEA